MANIVLTARDERFIAAMKESSGAVGVLAAKINVDLKNSFKNADYTSREFQRGLGRLGTSIKNTGRDLVQYVTLPLGLAAAGMLRTYGNIEKLKIGLDRYGVSLRDIKRIAKTPGLGVEEAARSVQMLADAKFNIDLSKKAVVEFGNALTAAGRGKEELEGVFRAFSQIKGKGKVQAEEINQIAERLPIIRSLMTEIYGTADTEKLQKLGITADEFLSKLTERLAELPRVAGGFSNAMGNIGDSLKIAAFDVTSIANKMFDFEGIANRISTVIESASTWFGSLSPVIQKSIFAIAGLAFAAGPLLVVVGGIVSALPFLTAGFGAVIAPIAAFAAGAALIISNWDIIKPYFSEIGESLFIIFNSIKAVVENIWGKMANNISSISGTLLKGVVDIFSIGLRAAAEVFRLFGGILTGDADMVGLAVKNIFKSLWNGVVSIFQSAATILINITANIFDTLGADANAAKLRKFGTGFRSWTDTFKADLGNTKSEVLSFTSAIKGLSDTDVVIPEYSRTPGESSSDKDKDKRTKFSGLSRMTGYNVAGQGASNFAKNNAAAISAIIGTDISKSATVLEGRYNALADKMKEAFKKVGKVAVDESQLVILQFNETLKNIGADFLANAFDGIFSGGGIGGALKGLLSSLGSALQQVGKQFLIANKAIVALKVKFGTALGIPGSIAAIVAGGLIKGMANNIQVPALAAGGLAYGPTLAMVGDNRGAGVDPEVIAPLSKLKGIMQNGGGGGGYIATTEILFDRMLIGLKRAERRI